MRAIHLCFRLHEPQKLGQLPSDGLAADFDLQQIFDDKDEFAKLNERVYQPFFALMERNLQKHRGLHFSLAMSGIWLNLAEKFDPELIKRLKKILSSGRVDLILEPFYHSVSFFYDQAEFLEQTKQYRDRAKSLLGVESKFYCQPRWLFNNDLALAAEKLHFAGMLASGAEDALGFRSVNHVYEVVGCEYLRVLFGNEFLVNRLLSKGDELLEEQKQPDGTMRQGLSWTKFRKELDLSALRGGLINMYLDVGVFDELRERGIVRFFDEMWASWSETDGNEFVGATGASSFEVPRQEVSLPDTIGQAIAGKSKGGLSGVVRHDEQARLPQELSDNLQEKWSHEVYNLRKVVLSSESEDLIALWRALTSEDFLENLNEERLATLEAILTDLKDRIEQTKKAQVVEIAREMTKKPNMMRIQVVEEEPPQPEEPVVQIVDEEMPDRLHGKLQEFGLKVVDDEPKPEPEPRIEQKEKAPKQKKRRRFIRRLVIE